MGPRVREGDGMKNALRGYDEGEKHTDTMPALQIRTRELSQRHGEEVDALKSIVLRCAAAPPRESLFVIFLGIKR
jgi:hypothetical protein